jgi:hypothetical protein
MEKNRGFGLKKTKPIQSQTKPIAGLWLEILKQEEWITNDRV